MGAYKVALRAFFSAAWALQRKAEGLSPGISRIVFWGFIIARNAARCTFSNNYLQLHNKVARMGDFKVIMMMHYPVSIGALSEQDLDDLFKEIRMVRN